MVHVSEIINTLFYPFGPKRGFCRRCQGLLLQPTELCESCFRQFDPVRRRGLRLRGHPLLKKIQVRSMWSWYPGEDAELSGLILALKKQQAPLAWRNLARGFLQQHAHGLSLDTQRLRGFIPVPSRTPDIPDHASLFAAALAAELGLPLAQPLRRRELGAESGMKKRRRAERLETISWVECDPDFRETMRTDLGIWVLVDDVLTTGATSRECLKALGLNEGFLWVLAVRERKVSRD